VGLAVIGFERTATVRGSSKTVRIEYDPPIGIRLVTSGISFKVNIPKDFITDILQTNRVLRRDIILQLLANNIADIMRENSFPSYHHELLISSIISAIHLDEVVDEKTIMKRLKDEDLISSTISAVNHELVFYESTPPDVTMIRDTIGALQELDITDKKLQWRLKQTIMHSLAHVILLSAAITSGSQLDDLDYMVKDEKEEVVIFDAVSGGNGSSETVFEFLSEEGKFDINTYLQSEEREEMYRPRNFDETVFEIFLPCLNGVSDRIFLFGKAEPLENEIQRKLNELKRKATTHGDAISRVRNAGNSRMFPISIGYHAIDYSRSSREADRFKEIANICLHGCPECISIGRKCHAGSFFEKYNISKLALDELLRYSLREATLIKPSNVEILKTLSHKEFVVIKGSCRDQESCKQLVDELNTQIIGLTGKRANSGHIKFAGHWINTDVDSNELNYYYLLKVI
jgi:hypothetical protein